MPLGQQKLQIFTKQAILQVINNQFGLYGILSSNLYNPWVYIGKGDIRGRMLDHINGDIPKIFNYSFI